MDPILTPNPEMPLDIETKMSNDDIVLALEGYREEAENARKSGPNPRDAKWEENADLYWNRYDFSGKADWQAKEVLPEVPSFVDRFAAALKEALIVAPGSFYDIYDPSDQERDITSAIKRMTDAWLSTCGRGANGAQLAFPAVFEEQVKLGALMASTAAVTWKTDGRHGRVAVESFDPRNYWCDHTGRGLYRFRRLMMDRHELRSMAMQKDGKGKLLYDAGEMFRLVDSIVEEQQRAQAQRLTGHGSELTSARQEIQLDEYLATVLSPDGEVVADQGLFVVANNRFLLRGPEKNPFWHGQDWVLFAPLVTAPLSVYGRSYMEDFGSVSRTFNEMTNLIIDAVRTSSMKMYAMVPDMLMNPGQVDEGASPNKIFKLEDGYRPEDFFKQIDMGNLPAEAVQVWNSLKNELREAAGINEIGMGQFAPNSRTSATEISETQQSSSALIRSVAETIETNFLNPMLDRVWKTGLQHVSKDDKVLRAAAGSEMFDAILSQRREFASRPMTFQARGISALIQKSRMLRSVLQLLQIISANEVLLREFLQVADMRKLVELLFELSDIDLRKLQLTERERMMREMFERMQPAQDRAAAAGTPASDATTNEARQVAGLMGVNR